MALTGTWEPADLNNLLNVINNITQAQKRTFALSFNAAIQAGLEPTTAELETAKQERIAAAVSVLTAETVRLGIAMPDNPTTQQIITGLQNYIENHKLELSSTVGDRIDEFKAGFAAEIETEDNFGRRLKVIEIAIKILKKFGG